MHRIVVRRIPYWAHLVMAVELVRALVARPATWETTYGLGFAHWYAGVMGRQAKPRAAKPGRRGNYVWDHWENYLWGGTLRTGWWAHWDDGRCWEESRLARR